MSRWLAPVLGTGLLGITVAGLCLKTPGSSESVFEVTNAPPQLAPMCPWRDPVGDLKQFFPDALSYELETRILSGLRVELARRLGRLPNAEENALHVYRVLGRSERIGQVTTRRVKGTYGAIELVLATDTEGRMTGLLLQRLREPTAIAEALQSEGWQRRLLGRTAQDSWDNHDLMAALPEPARPSAEAILDGVRSTMILLEASTQDGSKPIAQTHNH